MHERNKLLTWLRQITLYLLLFPIFDQNIKCMKQPGMNVMLSKHPYIQTDWWCNLHLCVAEAYKTRGRAFPGRKLRHLVTSKAGYNQASGSFLSAGSYSRYAAGCMVGGLSQFVTEVMMKTLSWLFLHPSASCWSKDNQVPSLTAEKCFFLWRFIAE